MLIVGLGNPGRQYEQTRHNIGFVVARAFAEEQGFKFKRSWLLRGEIAKGVIEGREVVILLPTTYMNLSGVAVKRCMRKYGVDSRDLLVISDDIALPFGALRIREKGSAGGHRGLKSVEAAKGNREYPRLKVGIGECQEGDLKEYVLGNFTPEEKDQLPRIVQRAVDGLKVYLSLGIQEAMKTVN